MPSQSKNPELYKIKTIAALTGFNPTLLRAWERRYNLLLPIRTPTGHRLYTGEDLQVLRRVRTLLDQGRSIGEIVAHGRPSLIQHGLPGRASAPSPPLAEVASAPLPELQRLSQQLISDALELNDEAIQRHLDEAFGSVSPVRVVEQVIAPAAREIGRLWSLGMASVASEHLLTSNLQRRLQRLIQVEEHRPARHHAVCCGFPEEFHELGTHILTYYLLQFGVRVIHLGAAMPFDELSRVIQQRQPDFVLASVTRAEVLEEHLPDFLALVDKHQGQVRFVLGGSAVDPEKMSHPTRPSLLIWDHRRPLSDLRIQLQL